MWEFYTQYAMPGLHRETLIMNQTIRYVTRKPIPTFLLWSTVISTFLYECVQDRRGRQEGEEQGGECIMYKEK